MPIAIPAATLTSPREGLDKNMHKALQVKEHPDITFSLLRLEIEEQPDALIFRDRCGRSFVRYEGTWRLSNQNGHTAITYELIAEPSFDVPGFMLKRLFRRDSAQMIERLRREIAARSTHPEGLTSQSPK